MSSSKCDSILHLRPAVGRVVISVTPTYPFTSITVFLFFFFQFFIFLFNLLAIISLVLLLPPNGMTAKWRSMLFCKQIHDRICAKVDERHAARAFFTVGQYGIGGANSGNDISRLFRFLPVSNILSMFCFTLLRAMILRNAVYMIAFTANSYRIGASRLMPTLYS